MAAYTGLSASTAAVANRYVTSTNMKVGAYTIANASPVWQGGAFITVTHATVAAGTDTLGTITIVGVDLAGNVRSEVITPIADSVATGTIPFRSVTSATGAGWVIAGGNDTITIGVAAGSIVCGTDGSLYAVVVNATAAATIVLSDSTRTIATLKASIAENTYTFGAGADFKGYLKVSTTSTNDVTVVHSYTRPSGI